MQPPPTPSPPPTPHNFGFGRLPPPLAPGVSIPLSFFLDSTACATIRKVHDSVPASPFSPASIVTASSALPPRPPSAPTRPTVAAQVHDYRFSSSHLPSLT
ncbi:hypothetical protein A4X13_0g2077 [Tilletia indica]|uniref:Uncharacterized protein n=1 Tax=Tilletia indica TaxID=43049 RepID=A0A177TLZ9_9BASI|nr:hypothetical protein A4X13_0g2077 [Tilletia indica]